MIKVKAIFIGQDGSCGYKQKHTYTIWFWIMQEKILIKRQSVDGGGGHCEYASLKAFLNNWEV